MNREETHHRTAVGLLAGALESGVERVRLQVRGHCMAPLVTDGDWVTVVSPAGAWAGQVVLARDDRGELVCHRVLGRGADGFLLAGDRDRLGAELPAAAILGRVCGVHRGDRVLQLDGSGFAGLFWRAFDRLLAFRHRWSGRLRETGLGRFVEGLRRRLLGVRALAWKPEAW